MNNRMNKLQNIIKIAEKYIIIATIVIFPLSISTSFTNLFETPKLLVLFTSIILLSILKTVRLIFFQKELSLNTSNLDLSLIIFTVFYTLAGFFNPVNKVDMFLYPANGSFIILSVIFFLFMNQFKKEEKELFFNSLILSGFFVAIIQIVSIFGIIKLIPFLPEVIKTEVFTPLGNILSSILFMVILLPTLIHKLFQKIDISEKVLSALMVLVFLTNILGSIYLILPNKETSIKILDVKTGWSLAIDALKINPLLGAGPSNFSHIFNKYRPIEFNGNENWQIKYIQSSSLILTILTESGILGLVAFLFFLYKTIQRFKFDNPQDVSILIFILGLITLPLSFLSFPLFVILLSLNSDSTQVKVLDASKNKASLFVAIPSLLILLFTSYTGYKLFYAEYLFGQSIQKVGQGQGIEAYNLINRAVRISPYADRYHLFSSVVNLALAESLATKVDITDEDKNNISRLVQQSIREAKAAVAVGKNKSVNWESLSNMYEKLVAFADGADTFAIESLNQAINLDPINPLLRIKLGSLYYSQQKYDLAIDAFKLAILAKPSLPNAHYNLAITYKETKQLEKAKEEMNTTLNLLGKESADYEKALSELQNIEELTKPEVAPEPIIEPQIELPQEEVTEPQI